MPQNRIDTSWFDSDLFTKGTWFARSTDEQVELLNNYWHLLQRSVPHELRSAPAYRRLLVDMDGWWRWKLGYDDAVFRRAFSAVAQLWGGGLQAQYERELGAWKDRYLSDLEAVLAVAPQVTDRLVERGVDPDLHFREFPSAEGGDGSLWVGVGVVVLLVGFGAWSSYRMRGGRG